MKNLLKVVGSSKMPLGGSAKLTHRIGAYEVEEIRKLSEGGFAFVYLVKDIASQKLFALKKILCQNRERYLLAKQEIKFFEICPPHSNILKFYGTSTVKSDGENTREVLLLLEYCDGGHVLDCLDQYGGKMPDAVIAAVMNDIVRAVDHLHAQTPPIAHRDLKVENVLLGGDRLWKLCDFGSCSTSTVIFSERPKEELARIQEDIERFTTLIYRPPEMVDFYKKFDINEKVDIWMLGCLLYTLIYFAHPFSEGSALAISNARYDIPSTADRSPILLDLMHWMLALNPKHRPTAREILFILPKYADPNFQVPLPEAVVEAKQSILGRKKELDRAEEIVRLNLDVAAVKEAANASKRSSKNCDDAKTKTKKSSKPRHASKSHKSEKKTKQTSSNVTARNDDFLSDLQDDPFTITSSTFHSPHPETTNDVPFPPNNSSCPTNFFPPNNSSCPTNFFYPAPPVANEVSSTTPTQQNQTDLRQFNAISWASFGGFSPSPPAPSAVLLPPPSSLSSTTTPQPRVSSPLPQRSSQTSFVPLPTPTTTHSDVLTPFPPPGQNVLKDGNELLTSISSAPGPSSRGLLEPLHVSTSLSSRSSSPGGREYQDGSSVQSAENNPSVHVLSASFGTGESPPTSSPVVKSTTASSGEVAGDGFYDPWSGHTVSSVLFLPTSCEKKIEGIENPKGWPVTPPEQNDEEEAKTVVVAGGEKKNGRDKKKKKRIDRKDSEPLVDFL